jgi:hypothetical protein
MKALAIGSSNGEPRVGKLRMLYDILIEPQPVVEILAVDVEDRDQLRIGGKLVKVEDLGTAVMPLRR